MRTRDQELRYVVNSCFNKIITDNILKGVEKVLIKPNFVNSAPSTSGVTTDLRIIATLVRILVERDVEVIVGESSLEDTEEVFDALNVYQLEEFGARVINFDKDEWVRVESPLRLALKRFHIARSVLDCDLIISVAKMKTHMETKATLSIKNVLGMIPKRDRKVAHMIDIDRAIVDVFAYLKANKKLISFVDGIYALEGRRGPTAGRPVKMDLIIAGDDAVAVDATCVKIMGYDARRVEHLTLSEKFGLGEIENVEVIGERIEDVRVKFEMPPSFPPFKSYLLSYIMDKFFKKTPYLRFKDKCTLCKTCIKNCPIENITLKNNGIEIDRKQCIGCMICVESCKNGALDYEISHYLTYRLLKNIRHALGGGYGGQHKSSSRS